jgi:hypothetical protein
MPTAKKAEEPQQKTRYIELSIERKQVVYDALHDSMATENKSLWDKGFGPYLKSIYRESLKFHLERPRIRVIENGEDCIIPFVFIVPGTKHEILIERKMPKHALGID